MATECVIIAFVRPDVPVHTELHQEPMGKMITPFDIGKQHNREKKRFDLYFRNVNGFKHETREFQDKKKKDKYLS